VCETWHHIDHAATKPASGNAELRRNQSRHCRRRVKARVIAFAARDGQPWHWTSSHCDGALLLLNRTRRTGWRGDLPSAEHRFAARTPITAEERDRFQRDLADRMVAIATQAQHDLVERFSHSAGDAQQTDVARPAGPTSLPSDVLHRRAVAAALKAAGFYTTRRRLVRLPDPRRERA
jgi:hypothetical protein